MIRILFLGMVVLASCGQSKKPAETPAAKTGDTVKVDRSNPCSVLLPKELADRVASGELDVEQWLTSDLPTSELVKQIKGVKGVGNYAAENLLKLLGRYDGLALDSWTRAKFFKVRNNGRKANDKKIARYYARFNEWRGLALWCDVTRDWL